MYPETGDAYGGKQTVTDKSVTIAVIADTHVNRLEELPHTVLETLARVDIILHLGDFTSPQLLDDLKGFGNFYGVWGNHDRLPEMRRCLKRMEILEVGGKRLGIIHGLFYPVGLQRRLKVWFKHHQIDILLFGHNHAVTRKILNGILFFNPGTLTGKFPATHGSFGLLTLNGTVTSQVIPIYYDIPLKQKIITTIPAWIIREGTNFLNSWPYIDLSPLWNKLKNAWQKLKATSYRQILG
jgi:uncharacterized protein